MSDLQSLVIGTAGHIDHGKSTLIKALTGVDPDRLAEEKKRGITIELGFGEINTPGGHHFGVVDVPGHEKFVRHMVAGATGIDAALIVIAADDGVMVQTREHLAILELLGITDAIVCVTKVDKSDPELLELVGADIAAELEDTPFAQAPLVMVSSMTGQGIDELYVQLDKLAERVLAKKKATKNAPLRLPVDRVFTIAGAGTVITGTLWEGSVSADDEVEAVFAHKLLRVRSVQVHGEQVTKAVAGNRVALNLAGIAKDELERGEMLAQKGLITLTTRFTCEFTYLGSGNFGGSSKAFASGTRVHIHHATRVVLGEIHLIGRKDLAVGEKCFAQIRTEEPLALLAADRFIVRSFSPMLTIGGGVVLQTQAGRHIKVTEQEEALLNALAERNVEAVVLAEMALARTPLTSEAIAQAYRFPKSDVAAVLNQHDFHRVKMGSQTYFMNRDAHTQFCTQCEEKLKELHATRPSQKAFTLGELCNAMHTHQDEALFEACVRQMVEAGVPLVFEGGRIAHAQSASATREAEDKISAHLFDILRKEHLSVSTLEEIAAAHTFDMRQLQKVANDLTTSGQLIRLAQKYYFTSEAIKDAESKLRAALEGSSEEHTVMAATLRDALGVSRKYAIPLLEYFDTKGLTRRVGDGRYLV